MGFVSLQYASELRAMRAADVVRAATPTHQAPKAKGQGILTLEATKDGTGTGAKDTRTVKVYLDHLERDRENFGVGQSCKAGTWSTPFGNIKESIWNCHGSVLHAYDGSGGDVQAKGGQGGVGMRK